MTKAARHFDKFLHNFWVASETKAYLEAVADAHTPTMKSMVAPADLYIAVRGQGTWAHPKLAVFFARWLDVKFAVWCDAMIDDILKGKAEVVITKPQESAVAALPEEFTVTAKALKELKAAYVRVAFAGTWGGRTWNHQGTHALMSPPWCWCSSA